MSRKLQNPLSGKNIALKLRSVDEAREAFSVLPKDSRTREEERAFRKQLLTMVAARAGTWYRMGDPGRRCEIGVDGREVYMRRDDGRAYSQLWMFRISRQGELSGLTLHEGSFVFAQDGRRIDFPQVAEWWSREPVSQPKK